MTLDRDWERFKGGPRPAARDRIHVTLNYHSEIYFNTNAFRLLGKPEAVHLYYNPKKESIAVRPTSARLSDAFPVRQKKNGSLVIHASPFCQHNGIKMTATHKFVAPEIDNDGNMILDLTNTITVVQKRRSRKPRS
jgi:hypothetical protein